MDSFWIDPPRPSQTSSQPSVVGLAGSGAPGLGVGGVEVMRFLEIPEMDGGNGTGIDGIDVLKSLAAIHPEKVNALAGPGRLACCLLDLAGDLRSFTAGIPFAL